MTAVGVLICMDDAISWGDVFARAAFQIKKQKAEHTKAKKMSAIQDIRFEFVNNVANAFSSKIKAARVSSINPMAIDQNVIDTLENFEEFFLVTITEKARHDEDASVNSVPIKKSELNENSWDPLLEKSNSDPPIKPKANEIHL